MLRPISPRTLLRCAGLAAAVAVACYGVATVTPAAYGANARTTVRHPRPVLPARAVRGEPNLGANVYVFTPAMPESQVQSTVNSIASQQVSNQFGTQRYTLLFEPGTYGTPSDPLIFQVGYYEQVAGLGATPGAVVINGTVDVYNQCFATNDCIALDNFWRSLSNLTINVAGGSGCQTNTEFWAVSQAAPLRRVDINGGASFMDYCNGSPDFASGGFVADSEFTGGSIVSGSQQQFFVRNSDNGAPAQAFGVSGGAGPYTTIAASPVTGA